MDLSYGDSYEVFRSEMRAFLIKNKSEAPQETDMTSEKALHWQAILIELPCLKVTLALASPLY